MRFFTASFFILILLSGNGQLPANIKFTNYTRANGLPEENINSIVQDSRGFLWIGSKEGLIRFDGNKYRTWYANLTDSSTFGSNNVFVAADCLPHSVLFLSGGKLWQIDINNHLITRVAGFEKKTIITLPKKMVNGNWCVVDQDSVYVVNNEFSILVRKELKPFFPVNYMVSSFPLRDTYILLYTSGINVIYLFNYRTGDFRRIRIDNSLLDSRANYFTPQLYDSVSEKVYFCTYFNGTFSKDSVISGSQSDKPVPVALLQDGSIRKSLAVGRLLLMVGENGFYITDLKTVQNYNAVNTSDNPPAANIMVDLYQSQSDHFWLSTEKGISRFSLKPSEVNYWKTGLHIGQDDEIKAILKGNNGDIYFLARANSLSRINIASGKATRLDSGIYYCWSASKKRDEIIFTGSGKKMAVYNTITGKVTYPDYLYPFYTATTDIVTLVFTASNGDTWYSCNGSAGLIRNPSGTNRFIPYNKSLKPPSFSLNYVHTATEDKEGNIWFGSNRSNMLLKWNTATEKFIEYPLEELLPRYKLRTGISVLFTDHSGNLWIAMDGGAIMKYIIRDNTGSYYDINNGLPTNAVFDMCTDNKNRLWITTAKGISCYIPEKDKFINFTRFDGFPEDNFESYGMMYDSTGNILYAPSRHTISFFNPDSLLKRAIANQPPVFIDEMLVNGKTFYFDNTENIRLAPDENNLEFSIAVPDFNRNNQLVFQYKLTGTGNQWTDMGENRVISFNNLTHGKYTLSVRCRYKGSDTWRETAHPFTFIIRTPWNRSLWFRILLATLLLLIVGLAIRSYYRRKMEKQQLIMEKEIAIEQERTKMARELHDGLGSMLSGIKHSFAAMNKEFDLTEKQKLLFHSNLDKLNESIKELRNITHNMASDALLKYGIENSLRDYCSNTSASSGVAITFTALNTDNLKLSEEKSFHIFRIMQELLQNVIKHSGAAKVLVQISSNQNLFYITVEDNGKGFDLQEARKMKSMGLRNIESRVRMLRGELDFQTAPGKGTSVMITIPCG